ncbi:hypothetical protein Tco_1162298, partial [Tanacetum coccineum]
MRSNIAPDPFYAATNLGGVTDWYHRAKILSSSDSEHFKLLTHCIRERFRHRFHPGVDGPPIMPEDPYAYIIAAYEVPPSPDYIPGPEVPPSPDYIPGPEVVVQNSNSSAQQDDLILSVIEQLKTQAVHCTKTNLENKSVNDTLIVELERYKEQVKVLKEGQNVDLKSQDNILDSCA